MRGGGALEGSPEARRGGSSAWHTPRARSRRNEMRRSYNLQQLRWETAGIRSTKGLQGGEQAA